MNKSQLFDKELQELLGGIDLKQLSPSSVEAFIIVAKEKVKNIESKDVTEVNEPKEPVTMDIHFKPKRTYYDPYYAEVESYPNRLKDENIFPTIRKYPLLKRKMISPEHADNLDIIDEQYKQVLVGSKSYVSYYLTHPDIMKKVRTHSLVSRLSHVTGYKCININTFCLIASSIEGKDISQCNTYDEKFVYSALTLFEHESLDITNLFFSLIDFLLENKVDALSIALSLLLDNYKCPVARDDGPYNNVICSCTYPFRYEVTNTLHSNLCDAVMESSNPKYGNLKQVIELLYNIPGMQLYVFVDLFKGCARDVYSPRRVVSGFRDELFKEMLKVVGRKLMIEHGTKKISDSTKDEIYARAQPCEAINELFKHIF